MKKSLITILSLLAAAPLAIAQFVPPATSTYAVTVDHSGVLEAPTAGGLLGANPELDYAATQKYPVFVFEVPYGAPWTDFELKASRTNFELKIDHTIADGGPEDMVFYYHSPGETGFEIGAHPKVWYTATGGDPRRWRSLQESPRTSIQASLPDANSQVGSIIVVVTDPAVLDSAADPDLVWSIVWFDGSGHEQDLEGRAIWRAAQPTRWVPAIFTP